MLEADGAFQNTRALTRQDPTTGDIPNPEVTIVHEPLQELWDWSPCDSLSSDHRPITITLNLPDEQQKGEKPTPLECESSMMKVDEMNACMSFPFIFQ